MKNIRLLTIITISVILAAVIFVSIKQNSVENSFSIDELKQLVERYGEDSPIVSEYLDKHKNSKELEKQIIILRNNNQLNSPPFQGGVPAGLGGKVTKTKDSKDKEKQKTLNNSPNNQFASDDKNSSYSDYLDDAKPSDELTDKNTSTNSNDSLQALQEMLDNHPSRSNDFIVKLDRDINGLEINVTGREARVSADLLNSDLFENGVFSNAPGIWITGLDKFKDSLTYEALWQDYKNRFFDIPGYGTYIMKDELSEEAFAARKIEIINELINKNPNNKLYEELAGTFAESGDMNAAEKTIGKWSEYNNKINYDYEMAEIYRINGENSKEDGNSQEYLQSAVSFYEQANTNPKMTQKTALPLAKTYEKLGDLDGAIRTLENSYDYGENKQWQDDVTVQLGNYYSKTGDDYAALNWYEKSPKPGFINNVRSAEAYQRLGDTQSAIKYYEKSIKYNRNDRYNPMISLGLLYSQDGNNTGANEMMGKINNHLQKLPQKRRTAIKKLSSYQKLKNISKNN